MTDLHLNPLRQARESRGVSRFKLAVEIGTTERTIARWEAGEGAPSIHQAVLIADALEATLDEIAGVA